MQTYVYSSNDGFSSVEHLFYTQYNYKMQETQILMDFNDSVYRKQQKILPHGPSLHIHKASHNLWCLHWGTLAQINSSTDCAPRNLGDLPKTSQIMMPLFTPSLLQIIDFQYHASSTTILETHFRAWLTTLLSDREQTIHAEINHKTIY